MEVTLVKVSSPLAQTQTSLINLEVSVHNWFLLKCQDKELFIEELKVIYSGEH